MSIFSVIGLAMVGTVLAVLLKNYLPQYSLLISIGIGIIILFWVTINLIPVLDFVSCYIKKINISKDFSIIVLKSLGLAFITQLAIDICKDSGEVAIANKVELAGKVSILIASLPLFEKIISIIFDLLN